MDAQGFLAALTPAVTDADARERFLADPKAVLAGAGLDLPEWFKVSARESDAAELMITVPALLDPYADLSEEQLLAWRYDVPWWVAERFSDETWARMKKSHKSHRPVRES